MKCPLLHHKEHNPDVYPGECFEDCLQEECAWWDMATEACVVLALSRVSVAIDNVLGKIVNRPHIHVSLAK